VPMILKGLAVTAAFFRNLRGFVTAESDRLRRSSIRKRVRLSDAFRGMPVLVSSQRPAEVRRVRPVRVACPTGLHQHRPGELAGSAIDATPRRSTSNVALQCSAGSANRRARKSDRDEPRVDSPPTTATRCSTTRSALLVPEALLQRRLGFLRGEYDREQAPEKRR